jgi:hypothetical protein
VKVEEELLNPERSERGRVFYAEETRATSLAAAFRHRCEC